MNDVLRTRIVWALVLAMALICLAGCETFIADGDTDEGINPRAGYFYLLDNDTSRLVMFDHNMNELADWPYSDFTTETYAQGLTFDGDALWMSVSGGEDNLFQLDLAGDASAQITRTLPAPPDAQGTVRDIAWDGSVFWVINSGSETYNNPPEIFQIDPLDGTVITRHTLPTGEPRALCYVGPNADVYGSGASVGCYYSDKDTDLVYRFDTAKYVFSEAFTAPVGPRGENYVYQLGIFFDGEQFWTTNSSGPADHLFLLDYDGAEKYRVDLPYAQPGAVVWADRDLREAAAPVVTQATPNTGGRTAHKIVSVVGNGFRDGLTVSFGTDVAVDSLSVLSSTEFVTYLTVGAAAEFGPRDITVTNPDGKQGVGTELFSVVEIDPSLGHLWFLEGTADVLYRYSINDREVDGTWETAPVAPGGSLQGLGYDGTDIWLAAGGADDIVVRLDTSGENLVGLQSFTAPLDAAGTVRDPAFDGTHFWFPNSTSDEIYRVDPADGTVLETIPAPGGEPRGAAWADGRLYCNDKDTDVVYVWDADASTWSEAFQTPIPPGGSTSNRYPTGMTWDGFSFWLCNSTGEFDYIFQIAPDGTLLGTVEVPNRGDAMPSGLVFIQN